MSAWGSEGEARKSRWGGDHDGRADARCCHAATADRPSLTAEQLRRRLIHRRAFEAVVWGMTAVNFELMYREMADKLGGAFKNWVPTNPGGRFEVLARFYGPMPPLFDKSWRLGDIEKVD